MGFIAVIYLAIFIVVIAGMWKTFEKAGQPGWGCIIPFYNIYLILQIIKKPTWWILLFFVPIANLVIAFIIYIEFAKKFGQGTGFGIGLLLLGFIFWPILGFGDAQYIDDANNLASGVSSFGEKEREINTESEEK